MQPLKLITRQRARALAEQGAAAANQSGPVGQLRRSLLRTFRRSTNASQSAAQPSPVVLPHPVLTPSDSELSWDFSGNNPVDSLSENSDYENVEENSESNEVCYQNVPRNSEVEERDSESEEYSSGSLERPDSLDRVSLVVSEQMDSGNQVQVAQLCDLVERMNTVLNRQPANPTKLSVAFPVFRGEEFEDVHEFINNYKRAARLNGWPDENLAIGLPLHLRGHASAWLKSQKAPDEMTFDELTAGLIQHFASGASEWRVRQALGQRKQRENESVADYSYSLRQHLARLNLPRTEWKHYFVTGLLGPIHEFVVLNQPETLEAAENYAKLKESVLKSSEKTPAFDAKKVSAEIIQELSKSVPLKDQTISVVGQRSSSVDPGDIRQIIRSEFQQLMGNTAPNTNKFRQRRNYDFPARGFRTRSGDAVCYNCGKKGHTYYYCRSKPDPRLPRSTGNGQNFGPRQRGQNNYQWNANQGN